MRARKRFPNAGRAPIAGPAITGRVRSVMCFRQDRQDSRDQQPHGAISRRTACRTLESVAAGQSLSCQYQVVGKLAQKAQERRQATPAWSVRAFRPALPGLRCYPSALTYIAKAGSTSPCLGRQGATCRTQRAVCPGRPKIPGLDLVVFLNIF